MAPVWIRGCPVSTGSRVPRGRRSTELPAQRGCEDVLCAWLGAREIERPMAPERFGSRVAGRMGTGPPAQREEEEEAAPAP